MATSEATSLKARSAKTVMGSISERLAGVPRNPAKQVTIDLLETIATEDRGKYAEVADKAMQAIEFLNSSEAPKNARNNIYLLLLEHYLTVLNRIAELDGGRVTNIDELKKERTESRRRLLLAFSQLPSEMAKKDDILKLNKLAGDPLSLSPNINSAAFKRGNWHVSADQVYYNKLLMAGITEKKAKEAAESKAQRESGKAMANTIAARLATLRRGGRRKRRTMRRKL